MEKARGVEKGKRRTHVYFLHKCKEAARVPGMLPCAPAGKSACDCLVDSVGRHEFLGQRQGEPFLTAQQAAWGPSFCFDA